MTKLSSRPPASSLSRRLAQLGLVVASLGLCFAAGETLARWLFAELSDSESFHEEMLQKVLHSRIRFDPKLRSHDPILGYRYPPHSSFEIHRDEFIMHVRTNAHGFRAPEPRPKDIDEYRVLLLGDSLFFMGVGIPELVSTDLARLMKSVSRGRRTSVYNYSVPGYNTIQELLVARMFHLELAADDVVLGVFLGNDPVANDLAGIDAQGAYRFDEGKLTELRGRLRHWVRWLPPSTLLRKIVKEIGAPRIRYALALEPAAIDRTLSLVLQIREVVGQTDARLTVVLIPSRSSMSGPFSSWIRSRA